MGKIKTGILNKKNSFSGYIQKAFSNKKETFKLLALFIFTILFLLQILMILINNSFYNNASDDILQYYAIIVDFISGLKDGTISWFNLNNYFGASFFSDVYYIPIDIFTGSTFILSYIMPIELAYSVTELIKIFMGVMLFAYYLHLQGMKNRTIFWMGIIYFISGGTVSFMAFPVFLSLTVYMPLALIVIHYFFKKKRWIVPLFAAASIFYDFYLGYTVLAFACFAYLLEAFKRPGFKFLKFIKESFIFVFLLLLGVVMAAIIAYPSIIYILEETYRSEGTFNAWIINIGSFELKLFQPNIYIRYIAKLFVEQKPVGFYGFENSYATEHISLYISVIGLVYMNYIFFMRDRISRIYKAAIFIAIIFMVIPLFSYVFSGTMDAPYTRWINMLPIFQIIILSHVFDKYGFEKVKMKFMSIIIGVLLALIGGLMYYYISQLKLDDYLASRELLTADTVVLGIAALSLIIFLIFGWLKKWTVIKVVFWIEFLIAIGYIYSGPFIIRHKIDTFENGHNIDEFLTETIESEEFFRVYVDIDNLGVEDTNFNRMTSFPTNTEIFHSWTDYETNAISKLLFNATENQSKDKMNTFGYYLSHFLGYKYVLCNGDSNYGLFEDYFELISDSNEYKLYEIKNVSAFKVYESYMTYDDFNNFNYRNEFIATEKLLLMGVLIDVEEDLTSLASLEYISADGVDNKGVISIDKTTVSTETVITNGVGDLEDREFYKYANEDLDITFTSGSIYIKGNATKLEDYGEIFLEFSDGSRNACQVQTDQSHQVKCDFSSI
ncbi:MAG: YfhO family protein, partial [Tenericutes bacterium]|nr:YfhO family protein [Mycoplasmatota bacterium]